MYKKSNLLILTGYDYAFKFNSYVQEKKLLNYNCVIGHKIISSFEIYWNIYEVNNNWYRIHRRLFAI